MRTLSATIKNGENWTTNNRRLSNRSYCRNEHFFVHTNIIEQQHAAGVKSPLLRIIDTEEQITKGKLQVTSRTAHKISSKLQFKKLITSIEEMQIEMVSVTARKVPFLGTGLVALTLKFRKF